MLGKFEGDEDAALDTPESESYSAWTECLAQEHAQIQPQQATEKVQHPKCMSASYHCWQQENECQLFQEQAQAKEELRESRTKKGQEARGHCRGDCNRTKPKRNLTKRGNRFWCLGAIPWHCLGRKVREAMAAALVARAPPTDQRTLRKYLRVQQVQWHPDFLQQFGGQNEAKEREKVIEIVITLSQVLSPYAEGLK
ncbi:LOW QUALITY PROTEIN: NF-kappa-B inhibitor-like protein 1 [Sarcophilus harrisii]